MKDAKPYLMHILEECKFLQEKSKNLNFEKFNSDDVLKKAFVRSLEIIGEAVKNIPSHFRKKYSFVPWKEIAGMRDRLIHEYFGVNYKIVWKAVKEEIPELEENIKEIFKREGFSYEKNRHWETNVTTYSIYKVRLGNVEIICKNNSLSKILHKNLISTPGVEIIIHTKIAT